MPDDERRRLVEGLTSGFELMTFPTGWKFGERRLARPATITLRADSAALYRLAERALCNKGRSTKLGPFTLTVLRAPGVLFEPVCPEPPEEDE